MMKKTINYDKYAAPTDERELMVNYRTLDKRGKHEVQMAAYLQLERMVNECIVSHGTMQQAGEKEQRSNIINFRTSLE